MFIEVKEIFQFDKVVYLGIREKFYNICMSYGVIKKMFMGFECWKQFKDWLIRESLYLCVVMWDQENIEQKKLVVEIICNDIIKCVWIIQIKVFVVEVKRFFGLDFDVGREICVQLYNILVVEWFGFVFEEGIERFWEFRQRWIDVNEVLKEVWINQEDFEYVCKVKVVIVFGCDVEWRYYVDVYKWGIDFLWQRSFIFELIKKLKFFKFFKFFKEFKEFKVLKKRGRFKKVVFSVEDFENEVVFLNVDVFLQLGMNQGQDWFIGGVVFFEIFVLILVVVFVVVYFVLGVLVVVFVFWLWGL